MNIKIAYKLFRLFTLFVMFFTFFSACKKENHITDYTIIDIKVNATLKKIIFINDSTGYLCGGKKNDFGIIYKSTDSGNSWYSIYLDNNKSINDIFFISDSLGYACGDELLLIKTTNGGQTWYKAYDYSFSNWQEYVTPLQSIWFLNKDTGFVSGGDNYYKGVICKTFNGGLDWTFQSLDNEQKSIFFNNNQTGYFSGYGIIYKTDNGGKNLDILDIDGDSFVSVFFVNSNNGFAAGYNGGIYKTTDAGNSWKAVLKGNSLFKERININNIRFINNNSGYAVGNNGLLLTTNNSGNDWSKKIIDKNLNLYSIFVNNHNEAFISADNGKIIKITSL